ncbi:MAG: ABC transporter substrate-binding protein, partial [Gammaproteobacteria bacterium]|nr:ABC transporter substrate-binding protein [Gammaproteobacteria bacterium]
MSRHGPTGRDSRTLEAEGAELTRSTVIRAGLVAVLVPPWLQSPSPAAASAVRGIGPDGEIVLGVSAAFSGPSRGLGTELYRAAKSDFNHINENGGVNGRKVA